MCEFSHVMLEVQQKWGGARGGIVEQRKRSVETVRAGPRGAVSVVDCWCCRPRPRCRGGLVRVCIRPSPAAVRAPLAAGVWGVERNLTVFLCGDSAARLKEVCSIMWVGGGWVDGSV